MIQKAIDTIHTLKLLLPVSDHEVTSVPVAMHVIGLYSTINDFENTMFSDGTRNMVESNPEVSASALPLGDNPNPLRDWVFTFPLREGVLIVSPDVAYVKVKLTVAAVSSVLVIVVPSNQLFAN
jgi:hypothetical protein